MRGSGAQQRRREQKTDSAKLTRCVRKGRKRSREGASFWEGAARASPCSALRHVSCRTLFLAALDVV